MKSLLTSWKKKDGNKDLPSPIRKSFSSPPEDTTSPDDGARKLSNRDAPEAKLLTIISDAAEAVRRSKSLSRSTSGVSRRGRTSPNDAGPAPDADPVTQAEDHLREALRILKEAEEERRAWRLKDSEDDGTLRTALPPFYVESLGNLERSSSSDRLRQASSPRPALTRQGASEDRFRSSRLDVYDSKAQAAAKPWRSMPNSPISFLFSPNKQSLEPPKISISSSSSGSTTITPTSSPAPSPRPSSSQIPGLSLPNSPTSAGSSDTDWTTDASSKSPAEDSKCSKRFARFTALPPRRAPPTVPLPPQPQPQPHASRSGGQSALASSTPPADTRREVVTPADAYRRSVLASGTAHAEEEEDASRQLLDSLWESFLQDLKQDPMDEEQKRKGDRNSYIWPSSTPPLRVASSRSSLDKPISPPFISRRPRSIKLKPYSHSDTESETSYQARGGPRSFNSSVDIASTSLSDTEQTPRRVKGPQRKPSQNSLRLPVVNEENQDTLAMFPVPPCTCPAHVPGLRSPKNNAGTNRFISAAAPVTDPRPSSSAATILFHRQNVPGGRGRQKSPRSLKKFASTSSFFPSPPGTAEGQRARAPRPLTEYHDPSVAFELDLDVGGSGSSSSSTGSEDKCDYETGEQRRVKSVLQLLEQEMKLGAVVNGSGILSRPGTAESVRWGYAV